MRRNLGYLAATAPFLAISTALPAATIGVAPNVFRDADAVKVSYENRFTRKMDGARVDLRVRDGVSSSANILVEQTKSVDIRPGAVTRVDFDSISALGQKAAGTKLTFEAFVVGPNAVNIALARAVRTKVCTRTGPGRGKDTPRTCQWRRFQGY